MNLSNNFATKLVNFGASLIYIFVICATLSTLLNPNGEFGTLLEQTVANTALLLVTVSILVYTGLGMLTGFDAIEDTSIGGLFTGFVATQYFTYQFVTTNAGLELIGVLEVFSFGLGALAWFLSQVIVMGIAASILGIDMTNERMKDEKDPYGDKHARKILNSDE